MSIIYLSIHLLIFADMFINFYLAGIDASILPACAERGLRNRTAKPLIARVPVDERQTYFVENGVVQAYTKIPW